jgi:hypothetical protein
MTLVGSRSIVIGVETTLLSERSGPRILLEARDFPFLPKVHTVSREHPVYFLGGKAVGL